MTQIPLTVAYVAVPLGTALSRTTGLGSEVSPFLPWLVLVGLGAIWAMLFRRSGVPVKKRFLFEVFLFLILVTMLYFNQDDFLRQMELVLPLAVEMAPVGILGFCLMWITTFGSPDRADFQRYGALLAVFCIIDLAAEVAVYQAVPVVRWIGNCDVMAGLLLVSLCASLKPGENEGGISEPDQGKRIWRVLILFGLAACLSRTGLFGAGWIFLCFGRGSRLVRTLVSLAFFLLIGLSFYLPISASTAARYIDYWLWAKSVTLFTQTPSLLLTGLPLGEALPFDIPMEIASLWERITNSPAAMGIYLPQIQSFWLRHILGWGAIVPLCWLTVLLILLSRRLTRMGAGLAAALFAQGMSTPLLYNPSLGTAMGLALFLSMSNPTTPPETKTGPTKPAPKSEQDNDPAEEWDMRPL